MAPLERAEVKGQDPWVAGDNPNLVLIGKDRAKPVSLQTVIQLRWIALIGQMISVMIVYFRAGLNWPLLVAAIVLGALAVSNLILVRRDRHGEAKWLSNRQTTRILSFDIFQAGLVLWFSGGILNPFVILILAPVIISATILNRVSTALLCLMAVTAVTFMTIWSPTLTWRSGLIGLPPTYKVAVWASLVVAVVFVALFMQWVVDQARSLNDNLLNSQLALERERQVSAVGGLAAAAAHELGTPLSTITLIVTELARDLPSDNEIQDDLETLIEETDRCKEILKRLQKTPYRDPGEPYRVLPVSALVELSAQPYLREDIDFELIFSPASAEPHQLAADGILEDDQPTLPRTPELTYGLGNLLQNAFQFAQNSVTVEVRWSHSNITIQIMDDGPGFDQKVLNQLAQGPVVASGGTEGKSQKGDRREGYSGLGLGVYIAKTLLARSGGGVAMLNRSDTRGALVIVTWERAGLTDEQANPLLGQNDAI